MNIFSDLWLPILLSAVAVFLVSSVLHMALQFHKGDYRKFPGEAKVLGEMRTEGVGPGEYMFPFPGSMKEMGSPEMVDKYKKGPVGFLTVIPNGAPAIGKSLIQWFLYSILVGAFVAYAARMGLERGADYMQVFRLTGTVAILGYGISYIPQSIWKGASWATTLKFIFDGVVYGLVTAGMFGWLWPDAM